MLDLFTKERLMLKNQTEKLMRKSSSMLPASKTVLHVFEDFRSVSNFSFKRKIQLGFYFFASIYRHSYFKIKIYGIV